MSIKTKLTASLCALLASPMAHSHSDGSGFAHFHSAEIAALIVASLAVVVARQVRIKQKK